MRKVNKHFDIKHLKRMQNEKDYSGRLFQLEKTSFFKKTSDAFLVDKKCLK